MELELSLKGQGRLGQADAERKDKEKGSEHAKVGKCQKMKLVSRAVKGSVWLKLKICLG